MPGVLIVETFSTNPICIHRLLLMVPVTFASNLRKLLLLLTCPNYFSVFFIFYLPIISCVCVSK